MFRVPGGLCLCRVSCLVHVGLTCIRERRVCECFFIFCKWCASIHGPRRQVVSVGPLLAGNRRGSSKAHESSVHASCVVDAYQCHTSAGTENPDQEDDDMMEEADLLIVSSGSAWDGGVRPHVRYTNTTAPTVQFGSMRTR
jgi:hypothetical protein